MTIQSIKNKVSSGQALDEHECQMLVQEVDRLERALMVAKEIVLEANKLSTMGVALQSELSLLASKLEEVKESHTHEDIDDKSV